MVSEPNRPRGLNNCGRRSWHAHSISETMSKTMKDLAVAEKVQLDAFSGQIASLTKTSGEKLDGIRTESATGPKS